MSSNLEEDKSPHVGNELEDARKRFRSVLRLNILLSTINGRGHPTLRWRAAIPPKKRGDKSAYDLLKYVTTILVRNTEVIAAMVHPSSSSSGSFLPQPVSYQVNVMRTEQPATSLQQDGLASGTDQTDEDEALPAAFTAVANTFSKGNSHKDPYFEPAASGVNCKIVPGESHLKPGDKDKTLPLKRFLMISEKSSLEDHVATVAHYIKYVKEHKDDPKIMTSKLPRFIQYLVTRSWKKMHRRIHHWSSQGFIYHLGKVDETALRDAAPAASPLRNDYPLSLKLMSMDRQNTIQKFVATTSTGMPLAITSLLTACRDVEMMPRREGLENDDEVSGLYNKTTCVEFHQLLISTLLSFGKVLEGYSDARGKQLEERVQRAAEVYACGTLLWFIGYSRILRNHLKLLNKNGWLRLPTNSKNDLDNFFGFTHFENKKKQVIVQPTDEVYADMDEAGSSDEGEVDDYEGDEDEDESAAKDQVKVQPTDEVDRGADEAVNSDEGGVDDCEGGKDEDESATKDQVVVQPTDEVDRGADEAVNSDEGGFDDCEGGKDEDESATKDQIIVQPTDEVDRGADEAGNNGKDEVDDCENEGGEDEDQEFESIANNVVSSGLYRSFLDWILLQVDRFQAPRKITSFMKRTRTPHINLTLLAVRIPTPKPAEAVMEPWKETIQNLCVKSNEMEPEETIRILQEKINEGKTAIDDSCDENEIKDSIFHKFDAKTYDYIAAVHCETALASMEKFPGAVVCDDALRAHLQNFDDSAIAVSKPCCPVCWELLKILRNKTSTNLYVDGHHKTLSQVELPEWLPLKIVVKLTDRFENILLGQIARMLKRHRRHEIHPSGQSRDDFSSDSEDGEDDLVETIEHDPLDIPQNDRQFF